MKITLNNITGGYLAPATVNANSVAIAAAFENTLSLDGTSPNAMLADLDMNSNRIINLGSPENANDAARLADIGSLVTIAIAPSQSGNKGKFLVTDGSTASWSHAFCDTSDFTKKVDFNLAGITTGTTRTKVFQNQDGTIYETGGTDIAVADGGTGLSTFGAKGAIPVATAATTLAAQAVGTDGHSIIASSGQTNGIQYIAPNLGFSILNGYLDWSVSGSALTIAIKGEDGNNPSTTNPVFVKIRSSNLSTGLPALVKIVAANSVVISSGSTLGTRSSVPFKVWVVLFDDAGTYRLGAINCLTTTAGAGTGSDVTAIYPLGGFPVASSTTEGAAGAADSAQVFYTGTGVSSKGYSVLGYGSWESGLGTAGTWSAGPTRVELYSTNSHLPGDVVQVRRTPLGASSSTTVATPPNDDTIPLISEGTQFLTQAITPNSAANPLEVTAVAQFAVDVTGVGGIAIHSLYKDATANAIVSAAEYSGADASTGTPVAIQLNALVLADSTIAQTYTTRAGNTAGGTVRINGSASGATRLYGGVCNSYIECVERMG